MRERLFLRWKLMFVALVLLVQIPLLFRLIKPLTRAVGGNYPFFFVFLAVYSLLLLVKRWDLLTWFERVLVMLTIPALLVESIFVDVFYPVLSLPGIVLGAALLLTLMRTPYVVKGKAYRILERRNHYESKALKATVDRSHRVVTIDVKDKTLTAPFGKMDLSRRGRRSTSFYSSQEPDQRIYNPQMADDGRVKSTHLPVYNPTYGPPKSMDGRDVERHGTTLIVKGRKMTKTLVTDHGSSRWTMWHVEHPEHEEEFHLSDPDDARFARWVRKNRKRFKNSDGLKYIENG